MAQDSHPRSNGGSRRNIAVLMTANTASERRSVHQIIDSHFRSVLLP